MRLLVTGGAGLVGRYVVEELAKETTIEVLDLKPHPNERIPFHKADILQFDSFKHVFKGFDAVVHLAGIPHPLNDPAEKVFRVNAVGTFNVLEACALHGIKRFIFMSSESVLGFTFSTHRRWPEILPIDEQHPLRPEDPYGLSKLCCEKLSQGYTRRTGIKTICLRAPWIWVPEKNEVVMYRDLVSEYRKWWRNLWAYVHVLDIVRAIKLSLTFEGPSRHETFFVCADENWTGQPSRALVAEFFPETRTKTGGLEGKASLISNEKARRLLGFAPKYSVRDILG